MEMFEVRKPGRLLSRYGDIIETCYMTDRIAQNGICETFEDTPYNWGFCARSCKFERELFVPDSVSYEETSLFMRDVAPKGSDFKKDCKNIQYIKMYNIHYSIIIHICYIAK